MLKIHVLKSAFKLGTSAITRQTSSEKSKTIRRLKNVVPPYIPYFLHKLYGFLTPKFWQGPESAV